MAPPISTSIPACPVAGDTWRWTASFADYPISEGWSLSYSIAGADSLEWDAAWVSDDGETFTITIPDESTRLQAGVYQWAALLAGSGSYAGQRFTAARGVLNVLPDPASLVDGAGQSYAEKMLAIIETAIQGAAPGALAAYTIGGRSVQLMSGEDLRRWRAYFRTELYRVRYPGRGMPGERAAFTPVSG